MSAAGFSFAADTAATTHTKPPAVYPAGGFCCSHSIAPVIVGEMHLPRFPQKAPDSCPISFSQDSRLRR